jgi:two-component system LytT family response regulator
MKALIVDDEISNQENLQQLLKSYADDVQVCAIAGTIEEAATAIEQHRPELVFLDVQLHDRSGFDLLKQLNEIDFEIIFVTAYDQYGIMAIKFAALDYLLKPIDIDELAAAVNKARKAVQQKKKNERLGHFLEYLKNENQAVPRIALPLFSETRYISINDIVRCEADNTYTRFFLTNGEKLMVSKTLKEYAAMLQEHGFLRVHQSHLINPDLIKSWLKEDGGCLLLSDGQKIPVSKLKKDEVKLRLTQHFRM